MTTPFLGVGIVRVLEVSPPPLEYTTNEEEDDVVTDASYQTPPMASTSLATIPPGTEVKVPTPPAKCVCGEPLERITEEEEEFVPVVDNDGLGDVMETESEEEHFPEENAEPIPIQPPPPAYTLVCGQWSTRGCRHHSFQPYRFLYTECLHCESD